MKEFNCKDCMISHSPQNCPKKEFNLKKERKELFKQCKENYEETYGMKPNSTDWSSIDWIIKEVLRCVDIQDKEAVKRLKEYQDLKIKLAQRNKFLTIEEKDAIINSAIDNKIFFKETFGDDLTESEGDKNESNEKKKRN